MKAVDTNILREYIKNWLKSKFTTTPIYSEDIPEGTKTFPRIMFYLNSSGKQFDNREDFALTIQIHSNKTDATEINTMSGTVIGDSDMFSASGLDYKLFTSKGLTAHCYLDSRDDELTNETYLRQRNLQFTIKAYQI